MRKKREIKEPEKIDSDLDKKDNYVAQDGESNHDQDQVNQLSIREEQNRSNSIPEILNSLKQAQSTPDKFDFNSQRSNRNNEQRQSTLENFNNDNNMEQIYHNSNSIQNHLIGHDISPIINPEDIVIHSNEEDT